MKNLKFCFALFVITFFIISCKKDKTEPAPVPVEYASPYPNYSQLKVGNYWVYQTYQVDTLGNSTCMFSLDSCYVEKDTLINGHIYFKVYRNYYVPYLINLYIRDSLHYVVDAGGKILFSSQDFATIFDNYYTGISQGDTVAEVIAKMEDHNFPVNVDAGTFITSDYRLTYNMYPNWSLNGSTRIRHTRYAKDIGIVMETMPIYVGNPNYIERRLLRYHLN
jgi:hypothetical protein